MRASAFTGEEKCELTFAVRTPAFAGDAEFGR